MVAHAFNPREVKAGESLSVLSQPYLQNKFRTAGATKRDRVSRGAKKRTIKKKNVNELINSLNNSYCESLIFMSDKKLLGQYKQPELGRI